jgi:hypothetical protein
MWRGGAGSKRDGTVVPICPHLPSFEDLGIWGIWGARVNHLRGVAPRGDGAPAEELKLPAPTIRLCELDPLSLAARFLRVLIKESSELADLLDEFELVRAKEGRGLLFVG